jgi:hypothetical protein
VVVGSVVGAVLSVVLPLLLMVPFDDWGIGVALTERLRVGRLPLLEFVVVVVPDTLLMAEFTDRMDTVSRADCKGETQIGRVRCVMKNGPNSEVPNQTRQRNRGTS